MKKSLFVLAVSALQFFCGCSFFCGKSPTAETFTVNNVYGDRMVLQRQKPIRFTGTAEPGKSIKVSIGRSSVLTAADSSGIWKAVLPPIEAGGPYTVTVSGRKNIKTFQDVLIGEVWFCSGQSNMKMPVVGGKYWCSKNGPAEAAAANYPAIRIFQVENTVSPAGELTKIDSRKGWQVCTPDSIKDFSACAYYFGRELHKDLNVPVGLICSGWGGSRIETWISRSGFAAGNRTGELARIDKAAAACRSMTLEDAKRKTRQDTLDWLDSFYKTYEKESAAASSWQQPGIDTSDWQSIKVPAPIFEELGVAWFRKTISLSAGQQGKELTLDLGAIDDLDEAFFNGVKIGSTGILDHEYWIKPRLYKIPASLVKNGENTIAVRVSNIHSVGSFGSKPMYLCDGQNTKLGLGGNWLRKFEFIADIRKIRSRPSLQEIKLFSLDTPSTLYNGMVHPWTVYPMRGFLWYQGCSNSPQSRDYMTLQPLLIKDWRNRWNDDSMPFVFAQLAAYEQHTPAKRYSDAYLRSRPPQDIHHYPRFREVQTASLKVPLTGMAVAIDIGDHSDIHPANKQDLAFRLAQEAKRLAYGYKGVTSGPMYAGRKIEGDKIRITFTNTGSGLTVKGGKLNCFAIAGKDGRFVWADAELDGSSVIVSSPKVKAPVHVRYAWAGFPIEPNLYNKEGFPACPFRTDTPGYLLTEEKVKQLFPEKTLKKQ